LIEGIITEDGVPAIAVEFGSQRWQAIIDTGFNGELELPERLGSHVNARFVGRATSLLAANQRIEEEVSLSISHSMAGWFERKQRLSMATRSWSARACCGIIGCRSIFLPGPFSSRRPDEDSVSGGRSFRRMSDRREKFSSRLVAPSFSSLTSLSLKKARIARSFSQSAQRISLSALPAR
jgi:hypothetical protein